MNLYERLRTKTPAALATVLLVGAMIMLSQPGAAYAAANASTVGVVDYQLLVNQHPDMQKAIDAVHDADDQAKKDFADKSVGMTDQQKQDLGAQLGKHMDQVRGDLLKAIADKVDAAVKQVAEAKGLTIVVPKSFVIYGGTDITADVLKVITGK